MATPKRVATRALASQSFFAAARGFAFLAPVLICPLIRLAAASTTWDYTGGRMLVDVLDRDARSNRVDFHTIPANRGCNFGGVYVSDLASAHEDQRVQAGWSKGEAAAMGKRACFRLSFMSDDAPRFECTRYERPHVCLKDAHELPGRKERLYMLAFRGNLHDIAATRTHATLPSTNQRQSRTLHADHASRVGLRGALSALACFRSSPATLGGLLQPTAPTR